MGKKREKKKEKRKEKRTILKSSLITTTKEQNSIIIYEVQQGISRALPQLLQLGANKEKAPPVRSDGEVLAVTFEGNLHHRAGLAEQVIQHRQQSRHKQLQLR